jgi:hypothetical protein
METVRTVINGCVFHPGHRYMKNIVTGVTYAFSQIMMDANKDLREFTPVFNIVKENDLEVATVEDGTVKDDVVIEPVIVDVDEKDLTPAQKRAITKSNKKNGYNA